MDDTAGEVDVLWAGINMMSFHGLQCKTHGLDDIGMGQQSRDKRDVCARRYRLDTLSTSDISIRLVVKQGGDESRGGRDGRRAVGPIQHMVCQHRLDSCRVIELDGGPR